MAGHFIDIDNDRDLDILLLGSPDGSSRLLKNDGDGYFNSQELNIPDLHNPISISIADANADGYLDIALAQGSDSSGTQLPIYLLKNSGSNNFTTTTIAHIESAEMTVPSNSPSGIQAVQWIDYDSDGDVDLYATGVNSHDSRLLLNDGTGEFTSMNLHEFGSSGTFSSMDVPNSINSTSDWTDTDNDGHPNLLQPVNVTKENVSSIGASEEFLNRSKVGLLSLSNDHTSFAGSGTWSDVNNDGNVDALITSSCDCRFATLYTQNNAGEFEGKEL